MVNQIGDGRAPRRPIGDLVLGVRKVDPRKSPTKFFSYIDISSIDNETKTVENPSRLLGRDAPSRARQAVEPDDVIVSTVRPNLNAVAQLKEQHRDHVASTGFCVLRPDPNRIDSRYLFHWVRTPEFVGEMVKLASGASYPAVTDKIVKHSDIPLPPIEEQRRMAAVLDAADALRAKRRRVLAKLDTLTQAVFIHMFTAAGWDRWESVSIESLAAQGKGTIRTGPFGSQLLQEEFTDAGIAVLGIDNAVQNRFAWGERRYISEEKYSQLRRYTVFPGDVLVTIMGTTGRAAIVPENIGTAINTKHLCCITLDRDRCLPDWLWACLLFHPDVLRQLGSTHGAVMPGLNMGKIKQAEIPLPPIPVQRAFAEKKAAVEMQLEASSDSTDELDILFASVRQRAFRGDL